MTLRLERFTGRWGSASGFLGLGVWLSLVIAYLLDRVELWPTVLLFLLAPLVTVPLAAGLAEGILEGGRARRLVAMFRIVQLPAALLATASFFHARNLDGGLLTVPWIGATSILALAGLVELRGGAWRDPERFPAAVALIYLSLGAGGLFSSAAGWSLLGIEEPILLLFAVHYHHSAFAAPFLASLLGRRLGRGSPSLRRFHGPVAIGVTFGSLAIAVGFAFDLRLLRFLAIELFAACLLALALLQLLALPRLSREGLRRAPRILLALSPLSLAAAMCLAALYGWGDFRGEILIAIPTMAKSHGVLNGLGFIACGLTGWRWAGSPGSPSTPSRP